MATQKPITGQILSSQGYSDTKDYLNMYPKVGLETGYTEALANTDFKFSIGKEASASFSIIDKDSKHIVYYSAVSPIGRISTFKAYRYTMSENFIFEPEPVSLTFLKPNERLAFLINVGTNYVVAVTHLESPTTLTYSRVMIVKTNGSSLWTEWTLGYDVTSLSPNSTAISANFHLVTIDGVDYILRSYGDDLGMELEVYNSALVKQRNLRYYDPGRDVDFTDRSGKGRTGLTRFYFQYHANSTAFGFTWNPLTETFHSKFSAWNITIRPDGSAEGCASTVMMTWNIPKGWITSGAGTPNNLVPLIGGFRFRAYNDDTWDTVTGCVSINDSGSANSVTTDEYSGELHVSLRPTWRTTTTSIGRILTFEKNNPPLFYTTFNSNRVASWFDVNIPDGSPYAKGFSIGNTFFISNKMYTNGRSHYAPDSLPLTVNFFPNKFITEVNPNDTMKLDPSTIVVNPYKDSHELLKWGFQSFCTVMVDGNPRYVNLRPGWFVLEATLVNNDFLWSELGTVFPPIPATIQGVSVATHSQYGWNGRSDTPIFYALIKTPTYYRFARNTGAGWELVGGDIAAQAIKDGNASRGDTLNETYTVTDNALISGDGYYYCGFQVRFIGDTHKYTNVIKISDGSCSTYTPTVLFNTTVSKNHPYNYGNLHPNFGTNYGYCDKFGYFSLLSCMDYSSFRILCSKDPTGVGAPMTETEWRTNAKGFRYELVVSASSAVGLVAYLSEYPIFIGGYYTKIPQTALNLKPNADNYVYASRGSGDRDSVNVSITNNKLNDTFSRVCLCKITTNDDSVVSSKFYSIDGTGLPDQEGKEGYFLTSNGKTTFWRSFADIPEVQALVARIVALEVKVGIA